MNTNKIENPICPYCGRKSYPVKGTIIYPSKLGLHKKWYWLCKPCDAYVGCHNKSKTPLGRLADKTLRVKKSRAHEYFDPLWQSKHLTRTEAYKALAQHLGITECECHIGKFSGSQCEETVDWALSVMPSELKLKVMFPTG